MRRLLTAAGAMTLLMGLALTSTAHAAFFPGEPIDNARLVGDIDLARDGTGGVTYIKRLDGVDHVFVSRFIDGRFQPPERVDTGFSGFSSKPVIAAAPEGRLLVAFSNGGFVHGVVRPVGKGYFGPTALGDGTSPSADMSGHGVGMVSFTSNNKNVRIARLDRKNNRWTLMPQVADISTAASAGGGAARSKIAVAADGVGLVTWGESSRVYARKVYSTGLSSLPQQLTPESVAGKTPNGSDMPDVDVEEDSSLAWVVFRQSLTDGTARILARRQRGTAFDGPIIVDAGGEPATMPRIDLHPRGRGIAVSAGTTTRQPSAARIDRRDTFSGPGRIFFGSTVPSTPTVAMADNGDGLVATVLGGLAQPSWVRVRPYLDGVGQPEFNLSRSQFGGVAPGMGLEVAADRDGFIVVWIQGGRLTAGYEDQPPGNFSSSTRSKCCVEARPTLKWRQSSNLWGAVRYDVYIDNKLVGSTTNQKLKLDKALRGIKHTWQIVSTDLRGQTARTTIRNLVVDDLRPRQRVRTSRKGRGVRIRVRSRDRRRAGHRTSGMAGTVITWGDGRKSSRRRAVATFVHRYRRSGTFTIKITTRDKAGNQMVRKRKVRVR